MGKATIQCHIGALTTACRIYSAKIAHGWSAPVPGRSRLRSRCGVAVFRGPDVQRCARGRAHSGGTVEMPRSVKGVAGTAQNIPDFVPNQFFNMGPRRSE